VKVGNDLWRSQIMEIHESMPQGTHSRESELELFYQLYKRMSEGGMSQGEIRKHFEETFNIKHSAFYTRLRKVGLKYVV
jgi:hypothetical protein